MPHLTTKKLEMANDILERYRIQLHRSGKISSASLEDELKKCWNTGYRALKDIMRDLSKIDRYLYLAVYYMENIAPLVVNESKLTLAAIYGIKSYSADDREQKRNAFWKAMPKE